MASVDYPLSQWSSESAVLSVDLDAIVANYRCVARQALDCECAAVVKADAYGLGVEHVVAALGKSGCEQFFVATLGEAQIVRRTSLAARVFVFEGFLGEHELFVRLNLTPVLNSIRQIEGWVGSGGGAAALHVDTGMNRLGCSLPELEKVSRILRPVLLLSHLACADETEHPMNGEQQRRFARARAYFPGVPGSLANSAGVFLGGSYHHDVLRPGIALYGGMRAEGLRQVARLDARILQVRKVSAGEAVGYNGTWLAPREACLATVGVGYADGYPPQASNRASGWLAGRYVPLVGRVSMDSAVFDVSDVPEARPGHWINVMGGHIRIEDLARWAQILPYALLTSLGRRYKRVYYGTVLSY